jgi:AraC-like DNA-binding protein
MISHYQKANHQLSKYIRTVFIMEGMFADDSDNLPIASNGMQALICTTETHTHRHESIVQLKLYVKSIPQDLWRINKDTTLIVYFFYPFVLAPLFYFHVSKLPNEPIDLDVWDANAINALKLKLFYAVTTEQKIDILDSLLVQQLNENKRVCEIIQYATDRIMCDPDTQILSSIQKELKLSERTFQRLFKKFVGVTPNQYRRICQFQLSFSQVRSGKFDALTDVAFDNGFADQSHFIRSFKEFTEITPNTYLKTGLNIKK